MKILDFPELRQAYEYDCGADAIQSILTYYGIEIREELILKLAKTNEEIGTKIDGVLHVLKKYELHYDSRSMMIDDVKMYIKKEIPVMMLLQAWSGKKKNYTHDYRDGHWVVAIGYDEHRIIFEDPYAFERAFLTHEELIERWHAKEDDKRIINHGIAVHGKKHIYRSKKIIHMD